MSNPATALTTTRRPVMLPNSVRQFRQLTKDRKPLYVVGSIEFQTTLVVGPSELMEYDHVEQPALPCTFQGRAETFWILLNDIEEHCRNEFVN